MSRPTLSILVPVFNAGRFLRATLESVVAQTQPADEVVILDNGSTDDTVAIAEAYADRPGFRLECNGRNIGAVPNWIRIATLARSAYLMWLPGDDVLTPDCVARWTEAVRNHPEIGLFLGGSTVIDGAGAAVAVPPRPPLANGIVPGGVLIDWMLANGQPNVVAGTVVRRSEYEAVGGYDARLRGAIDYDLYLRVAGRGAVFIDPRPNAACRDHAGQWSKDVYVRDNNDADVLFDKIAELTFLSEAQVRRYVEGLCDYTRQFYTRPLRDPRAAVAGIRQEHRRIAGRLRRWRESGRPYARHVRLWPRRGRSLVAWLLGATTPGAWALHRAMSFGKSAG
jgi:glycosyltransferase involved in cell wall biosynthesis